MSFARTIMRGAASRAEDGILEDESFSLSEGSDRLISLLGGRGTIAGPTVTPESVIANIAVFAGVRLKANAVRAIPCHVYRSGDGGTTKDYAAGRKSRVFGLVHEQPNPLQPAGEMWAQIEGHLELRGNGYLFKEKFLGGAYDGLVQHLWPVDPRRVKPKLKNGRRIFEISAKPDELDPRPQTLTDSEIVHIKAFGTSSLVGLSPISACREELATVLAVREFLARHIANGAHFPGYLYTEEDVTVDPEDRERIEEGVLGRHRGLRNTGKVPLFNAGLKWQQIGMTLLDQQFLELLGLGVADVCRILGIPPTLLNARVEGTGLTYRTTAEEDHRFLKYGINPGLTAMEDAVNQDPDLLQGSDDTSEFRREAHLQMDTLGRYQAHMLAIRAGWKNPNEVRVAENLPPVDGGDQLLKPGKQPDPETRALLEQLDEFANRAADDRRQDVDALEPALT